jgi:hypothetical protein
MTFHSRDKFSNVSEQLTASIFRAKDVLNNAEKPKACFIFRIEDGGYKLVRNIHESVPGYTASNTRTQHV